MPGPGRRSLSLLILACAALAARGATPAGFAAPAAPPSPVSPPGAAEGPGPAEIGRPRPALELDALDGSLVTGARVAGKLLVVEFFATWCQPCHHALADLIEIRRTAGIDMHLLLIDLGESGDDVRAWKAKAGATNPALPADTLVALDPNGTAAHRWGARRLPTAFVVDGTGVVRHINRGWGPGYASRMRRWLTGLAAATTPPSPASVANPSAR